MVGRILSHAFAQPPVMFRPRELHCSFNRPVSANAKGGHFTPRRPCGFRIVVNEPLYPFRAACATLASAPLVGFGATAPRVEELTQPFERVRFAGIGLHDRFAIAGWRAFPGIPRLWLLLGP